MNEREAVRVVEHWLELAGAVQERMTADPALTLLQAVEQVRTELGLAVGTDPLGNYITGNNLALHTMAQEIPNTQGTTL
ncbi:MAG: hypothetical protein KKD24_05175 [Proteobacteria bacterium]|nr:hypothetical protein [Pseudomonadota bacterium]MBU4371792.1 hypothetical protein [Pseudomonadota bacterium]